MVLVDDLLVRGTTSRKIADGPGERREGSPRPHQRPPTIPASAFYGASIRQGVPDSPRRIPWSGNPATSTPTAWYLSLEGMMSAVGDGKGHYCSSCYGQHPVAFPATKRVILQLALKLDKETVTS